MASLKQKILSALDRLPKTIFFSLFMISFVAGFRFVGEWLILDGQTALNYGFLIHHFAFYLAVFFLSVFNLSWILKKEWSEFYGIAGLGMLLGILPVFIDASTIRIGVEKYHYFSEFTPLFFSDKQPVGESVAAWLCIAGVAVYVFIASSSWVKALLGLIATYAVGQFAGWGAIVFQKTMMDWTLLKVPVDHFFSMWWLSVALGVNVLAHWKEFQSVFMRIHHTFIWGALVLLGAKLIGYIDSETVLRALIMSLSFLFVMLVNDYYDKETDRINLRESAITEDTVVLIIYSHILLVLTSAELDLAFGVFVFLSFILGLSYSVPKIFRSKRNFILGSLVEGTGAALCLLAGGTQFGPPLNSGFLPLVGMVGAGFMISSNIKDYKDFQGDQACGIATLYVVLHEKGWTVERINIIMAVLLAISLLVACPVLWWLNARPAHILMAAGLALLPSLLFLKMPTPSSSVKYTLLAVTFFVLYLVQVIPRLPL